MNIGDYHSTADGWSADYDYMELENVTFDLSRFLVIVKINILNYYNNHDCQHCSIIMIVKINILNYLNQLSSCWQLLYCQCLFMAGTSSSCTGFNIYMEFLQIYKIYLSMVLAAVWNGDASADVRHSSVELHHHPCPQQTKVPSSS